MADVQKPPCWDNDEDWRKWIFYERYAPTSPRQNYCQDCLPAYQQRMHARGRCKFPETVFVEFVARDPRLMREREIIGSHRSQPRIRALYRRHHYVRILVAPRAAAPALGPWQPQPCPPMTEQLSLFGEP